MKFALRLKTVLAALFDTKKKQLWGVGHGSQEELNRVKNALRILGPKKVGLELPDAALVYPGRFSTDYFSLVGSYLRNKKISWVPLEDSAQWDYAVGIDMAKQVLLGAAERATLESRIARFEGLDTNHTDPWIRTHCRQEAHALGILNSTPEFAYVHKLEISSHQARESTVLARAEKHCPDLIIIGDGHALKLKDKLSDYHYVSFCNR